jgi:ankyrin repeat protein
VNLFKSSALKFAVREGNIEIVNELLEKGANPLIKDTLGVNVLDIAKSNGYKDIEALLLKYKGKKYSEIIKRGGR